MSSLPILSSQTPNSGKIDASKSNNNALSAEDVSNGAAPFGELLAKQLSPQGRDIKSDLLKTLAQSDSGTLPADLKVTADQVTTELRTDGIAIPADLLASLQQKDQRMGRASSSATTERTTALSALRGETEARDPATKRIASDVENGIKPDVHLGSDKTGKLVNVREERTAKAGAAPDAAFAAALQAEKKTALSAATVKFDTAIQTTQPSSTAAAGMPNALSASAPASQTTATQVSISTPFNQPQWADDFSQKITWIATQRTQSAQLHMNPAQLGPLEVSLKLNGDQATVQFTSAHAAVRDAIEQSIPRLRDMLADSGISLGNTTVSDQAPREQQNGQAGRTTSDNSNAVDSTEVDAAHMQTTTRLSRHDGVVDTFV
jgi:flagellar hook-length control protein FliK